MEVQTIEKKESKPLILKVKNTTDDKIYNLDLLNNADSRVLINCEEKNEDVLSVSSFKELINSQIITVGMVNFKAFYEFKKFIDKQLRCSFTITFSDRKGNKSKKVCNLMVDPYQYDSTQVSLHDSFIMTTIDGCNTSLILEYLMPEMELYVYLYPSSIETK